MPPYLKIIGNKISQELQNEEDKTKDMYDEENAIGFRLVIFLYRRVVVVVVVVTSGVIDESVVLEMRMGAAHINHHHDEDDYAGNHRVNLPREIW